MLDLTDWQNKKFTTRDGSPVRILCVDAKGDHPVIGLRLSEYGREVVDSWSLNGSYLLSGVACNGDLINAKTKREGWVNVYSNHREGRYMNFYKSEASANLNASDRRIACVRVEWEE